MPLPGPTFDFYASFHLTANQTAGVIISELRHGYIIEPCHCGKVIVALWHYAINY